MSQIKVLKFNNGVPQEINTALDDLVVKSLYVGGPSGTALTKAILDTLSSGSADASSLHNHDAQYFRKTQFIAASTGVASATLPIETDSRGKFDPSFYQQSDIVHGNLSGLLSDDHPQYYNQTRGDARYYPQTTFIAASAGVSSAGLPIKTNAQGYVDGTFLAGSAASISHNNLSGLQGGTSSQYYHLTLSEHDTLTGAAGIVDASALHQHDGRYYTQSQIASFLALKANDNIVIKKDGSVAFTAAQSMGGFKLTNLADGAANADAVAYHQLTDGLALKLSKSGDTMTGTLNMSSNLISNLASPVSGTDAANKNYVDNKITGLSWRPSVNLFDAVDTTRPATTATQIDGVTITSGIRVLFISLTTGNNEVYTAAVSGSAITWTLAIDGQAGTGLPATGDALLIEFGSLYGQTAWDYNGTLWVQFNGAGSIQAGSGLTKSGNTLSVIPGAGITFVPAGDVGLNIYTSAGVQTVDPATGIASSAANAQLSAKLADATLTKSVSGLAVGVIQTANIASQAITTSLIADASVTNAKLASLSVATANIQDSSITTAKLSANSVTATKLASSVAGIALALDATTNAINVQVDNSSIDINGSNQVEIKALGVTTAKIAAQAVDTTKILFGTTGSGVQASALPLLDTANHFATKNVEAALSELANAAYIESFTAGETIGQGDLVVLRRDNANTLKAYKASAASADNYVSGTLILGDITYTAVTPSGNFISVAYTNPGAASSALSVTVTGNAISVSLATNGSSALTSTATQIQAAIAGSTSASALVTATISGTGSNIQTTFSASFLTGGMDYVDNGRWAIEGAALDAAASAGTVFRVQKFGPLTVNFVSAPTSSQIGQDVYLSINQGKAQVYTAPTATQTGIVLIGRLRSVTQIEFKAPILRGVNG